MMAWPLVAFMSRVRRPIRPRAGIVNSTCVVSPRLSILRHSPRRLPTASMTAPTDADGRQGDGVVEVGNGVADIDVFQPDHRANVAGPDLVRLHAPEPVEVVKLRDGVVDALALVLDQGNLLPLADLAGEHAADGNA